MGTGKEYGEKFKKQAVKQASEIGNKAAADELGIPKGTLRTWLFYVHGNHDKSCVENPPTGCVCIDGKFAIYK